MLTRDQDRIVLLEEAIRGLPGGDAELPPDRIDALRLIDRLFSESYGEYTPASSLAVTPRWLPLLFRRHCRALIDANRLDFGGLIHFANRLLQRDSAVARAVRLEWTHILVDEL